MTPGLRATLRLARRTALRQWRRTILVVLLVAVPVSVAVTVAGATRANRVTPQERATALMGQADATVEIAGTDPAVVTWFDDAIGAMVPHAEVARSRRTATMVGSAIYLEMLDLDATDPVAAGMMVVTEGNLPVRLDEVALSPEAARLLGAGVGDRVTLGEEGDVTAGFEVVGLVRDPVAVHRVLALMVPAGLDRVLTSDGDHQVETWWLVRRVDGVTFSDALQDAWDAGRSALLSPPAVTPWPDALASLDEEMRRLLTADEVSRLLELAPTLNGDELQMEADHLLSKDGDERWALYVGPSVTARVWYLSTGSTDLGMTVAEEPGVAGTLVGSLLLAEVAFVAAAAYATGTRRRLRELGLLGANGATTRQLRGTVVAEGLLAGIAGSALGILLAVVVLGAGKSFLQQHVDKLIVGIPLTPADAAGPVLAGIAAMVVAAWLPARTAARVPVTTALQGRMPLSGPHRRITPLGIGIAGFGTFLLVVGRAVRGNSGMVQAALGVMLMIGGVALLAGPALAFAGRHADRFPASLRLVLRDSARQRTRAAAAVAATMVVLIVPVVISSSLQGSEMRSRTRGLPDPANHVLVSAGTDPPPDAPQHGLGPGQIDAVAAILPGAASAPVTILEGTATPSDRHEWEATIGRDAFVLEDRITLGMAVATPGLLDLLDLPPEAAEAFRAGEPVLLGVAGRTTEVLVGGTPISAAEVPARVLEWQMPRLLLPAATAHDLGLEPASEAVLFVTPAPLTDRQRDALLAGYASYRAEYGAISAFTTLQATLLAVGVSFAVVLVIIGLVTALAATESDRDLRTMVAVGAPPRLRRRFLGLQTGYYTLFGAALAVPLAVLLMHAATPAGGFSAGPFGIVTSGYVATPWAVIALVAIALPVAVGLLTSLLAHSAPTVPPRRRG